MSNDHTPNGNQQSYCGLMEKSREAMVVLIGSPTEVEKPCEAK